MTPQKNQVPPWGEDLARAVTYERRDSAGAQGERPAPRPSRARRERPGRSGRIRPGAAGDAAEAVPIRPTVVRTHRLMLGGELGHDNAVALEAEIDALCESDIDKLVLDLGGLRSIDATGIRVISMRCGLCKRRGIRIEVDRVEGAVRGAFRAAGLLDRLPFAATPLPDTPEPPARGDENAPRKARKIV
jgi:anti-anti-sigma factor